MTTTIDESRVRAKVAARELCEQIVLLIAGEHRSLVEAHGPTASEAFWGNFRQAFEGHFPKPVAAPREVAAPMTDEECRRFGRVPMPQVFKKYAGVPVDETPQDYLEYIDADETKWFREQLNRYLRSDRVQRERDDRDESF